MLIRLDDYGARGTNLLRGMDNKTVREELDAMDRKLKDRQKIDMAYAANCVSWLRELERKETDTTRSAVTGY